jgi:hypothetical protein
MARPRTPYTLSRSFVAKDVLYAALVNIFVNNIRGNYCKGNFSICLILTRTNTTVAIRKNGKETSESKHLTGKPPGSLPHNYQKSPKTNPIAFELCPAIAGTCPTASYWYFSLFSPSIGASNLAPKTPKLSKSCKTAALVVFPLLYVYATGSARIELRNGAVKVSTLPGGVISFVTGYPYLYPEIAGKTTVNRICVLGSDIKSVSEGSSLEEGLSEF